MLTDVEIAQSAKMLPIEKIAESIGIAPEELSLYGKYKAKINEQVISRVKDNKNGKLILVTAVNPTPAGEGKTTMTVSLGQAMQRIGKNAIIALREPSLGPVFGIKGGAAGGGYAQVLPMEDINLHFTGDMHAITTANNLLCALIDNHIHQGNALSIDPRRIVFKRAMDMNDRALRNIIIGLGGKVNGIPREDGFMITVASEIMAILCLADDLEDLKDRLSKILVGYTYDGKPVYCKDLNAQGAMAVLMKDAIDPNLVQTLENSPCIMHGGPFANIAHGCNSVRATKLALKLADYCITEAGFGADLGAEKFFDIKCRKAGLTPSATVLVATVRALKYNGGVTKDKLKLPNVEAVKEGSKNLLKHIENIKSFGVPLVVAINHFYADTDEEIAEIEKICEQVGVKAVCCKGFAEGGKGAEDLARAVCEAADKENNFEFAYPLSLGIKEKIHVIATKIYGARGVNYTTAAERAIKEIEELGGGELPVCMAKTQYSLSDNQAMLGRPTDFEITVSTARLSNGAGFVVVQTGDIMTMPGLPKIPAADLIDITSNGEIGIIKGLF